MLHFFALQAYPFFISTTEDATEYGGPNRNSTRELPCERVVSPTETTIAILVGHLSTTTSSAKLKQNKDAKTILKYMALHPWAIQVLFSGHEQHSTIFWGCEKLLCTTHRSGIVSGGGRLF